MFLYPSPHSLGVKYLNVEFRRECCCRFQTITCFLCVGRDKLFRDGFVVTDIGFFSSDLRIPFSVQYCATSLGPTKKCRLLFGGEFRHSFRLPGHRRVVAVASRGDADDLPHETDLGDDRQQEFGARGGVR